jgi:hypothetical protein
MGSASVAANNYGTRRTVADPLDGVLRDIPLPPYVTGEDAQFAVRAVVVHAPEIWPTGPVCRKDGASYPCRLHRWGRRVLALRGLLPAEIEALVERGDPTAVASAAGSAPTGIPAVRPTRTATPTARPAPTGIRAVGAPALATAGPVTGR